MIGGGGGAEEDAFSRPKTEKDGVSKAPQV